MEHRPADSRRGTAGAHRQARHADDGRVAGDRFGGDLNVAVGAAVELLHLGDHCGDAGVWAVGFADDYLKLVKRRSLGLTGRQKLALQLVIAFGVWLALYLSTRYFATKYSWNVSVPFLKTTAEPNGISTIGPYLYLGLVVVVLLGSTNAVNLTDGLDGLAISVTFIAMTALTAFTYLSSDLR